MLGRPITYAELNPEGVELAYEANAAYDRWQQSLNKEVYISERYQRGAYNIHVAQLLAFDIGDETDKALAEHEDLVERAGALIGREVVSRLTARDVHRALIEFEARVGYGSSDGCY